MPSLWNEREAERAVERYGEAWGAAFVELVYASRLLGADRALTAHGGGNTSIKRDQALPGGLRVRALRVKSSGVALSEILPDEFTSLDLERVAALASLEALDDEELVRVLEAAKLDPSERFPSVEACLHAFLPDPVVLHTHAEAVLLLANQPDGRARIEEALGARCAVVDYVPPGFGLARRVREATLGDEALHGAVVLRHGLFTWGGDAKTAYARMMDAVDACTDAAGRGLALATATAAPEHGADGAAPASREGALAAAAEIAPRLRGALAAPSGDADRPWRRQVVAFRTAKELRWLLAQPSALEAAARGVMTPDHTLFARRVPLVLPADARDAETIRAAADAWSSDYRGYIDRCRAEREVVVFDTRPRVALVPGVGIFGAGRDRTEARAAAEIGERTLLVATQGDTLGRYAPAGEQEVFELEFWPPEQAKLRRRAPEPLEGRVALVTGGAGGIGVGLAEALARAGATVLLADRGDADGGRERVDAAADRVQESVGRGRVLSLAFDVSDPDAVDAALREAALLTGGVDLLVLCHGLAEVAAIDALDPRRLETVFGVNALGSFHTLGAFVRGVREQRTGGDVVLVSTKNVPDPGASFSAYSASKAAAHQLARVAAIELAGDDIRVNMVSPDAVFGDEANPSLLWQEVGTKRARSKGLDPDALPEHYRQRNLLKSRVTTEHVAQAVLFFAERRTPTTGAVIPVDGGLPGAFPR